MNIGFHEPVDFQGFRLACSRNWSRLFAAKVLRFRANPGACGLFWRRGRNHSSLIGGREFAQISVSRPVRSLPPPESPLVLTNLCVLIAPGLARMRKTFAAQAATEHFRKALEEWTGNSVQFRSWSFLPLRPRVIPEQSSPESRMVLTNRSSLSLRDWHECAKPSRPQPRKCIFR